MQRSAPPSLAERSIIHPSLRPIDQTKFFSPQTAKL
jgi:hypothetical protein